MTDTSTKPATPTTPTAFKKGFAIMPCSVQALQKPVGKLITPDFDHTRGRYPFLDLAVHECFTIPINEPDLDIKALRTTASLYGKRHGRKFVVIVHSHHELIEVARIA